MCRADPAYSHSFLGYLLNKTLDGANHVTTRCTCAAYLGSFLARSKFVPNQTMEESLNVLVTWCHNYCDVHRNAPPDGVVHGLFYSICESIFYVFLFQTPPLGEREREGVLSRPPSRPNHREQAESFQVLPARGGVRIRSDNRLDGRFVGRTRRGAQQTPGAADEIGIRGQQSNGIFFPLRSLSAAALFQAPRAHLSNVEPHQSQRHSLRLATAQRFVLSCVLPFRISPRNLGSRLSALFFQLKRERPRGPLFIPCKPLNSVYTNAFLSFFFSPFAKKNTRPLRRRTHTTHYSQHTTTKTGKVFLKYLMHCADRSPRPFLPRLTPNPNLLPFRGRATFPSRPSEL